MRIPDKIYPCCLYDLHRIQRGIDTSSILPRLQDKQIDEENRKFNLLSIFLYRLGRDPGFLSAILEKINTPETIERTKSYLNSLYTFWVNTPGSYYQQANGINNDLMTAIRQYTACNSYQITQYGPQPTQYSLQPGHNQINPALLVQLSDETKDTRVTHAKILEFYLWEYPRAEQNWDLVVFLSQALTKQGIQVQSWVNTWPEFYREHIDLDRNRLFRALSPTALQSSNEEEQFAEVLERRSKLVNRQNIKCGELELPPLVIERKNLSPLFLMMPYFHALRKIYLDSSLSPEVRKLSTIDGMWTTPKDKEDLVSFSNYQKYTTDALTISAELWFDKMYSDDLPCLLSIINSQYPFGAALTADETDTEQLIDLPVISVPFHNADGSVSYMEKREIPHTFYEYKYTDVLKNLNDQPLSNILNIGRKLYHEQYLEDAHSVFTYCLVEREDLTDADRFFCHLYLAEIGRDYHLDVNLNPWIFDDAYKHCLEANKIILSRKKNPEMSGNFEYDHHSLRYWIEYAKALVFEHEKLNTLLRDKSAYEKALTRSKKKVSIWRHLKIPDGLSLSDGANLHKLHANIAKNLLKFTEEYAYLKTLNETPNVERVLDENTMASIRERIDELEKKGITVEMLGNLNNLRLVNMHKKIYEALDAFQFGQAVNYYQKLDLMCRRSTNIQIKQSLADLGLRVYKNNKNYPMAHKCAEDLRDFCLELDSTSRYYGAWEPGILSILSGNEEIGVTELRHAISCIVSGPDTTPDERRSFFLTLMYHVADRIRGEEKNAQILGLIEEYVLEILPGFEGLLWLSSGYAGISWSSSSAKWFAQNLESEYDSKSLKYAQLIFQRGLYYEGLGQMETALNLYLSIDREETSEDTVWCDYLFILRMKIADLYLNSNRYIQGQKYYESASMVCHSDNPNLQKLTEILQIFLKDNFSIEDMNSPDAKKFFESAETEVLSFYRKGKKLDDIVDVTRIFSDYGSGLERLEHDMFWGPTRKQYLKTNFGGDLPDIPSEIWKEWNFWGSIIRNPEMTVSLGTCASLLTNLENLEIDLKHRKPCPEVSGYLSSLKTDYWDDLSLLVVPCMLIHEIRNKVNHGNRIELPMHEFMEFRSSFILRVNALISQLPLVE